MFYYKITTTGRNSAAPSAIFQINWFDKRVASIDILLFVKTLENEKARRKFTRGNMKTNVPRQMHAAAIIITILRNFTGHRFSSSPSFLSFFLSFSSRIIIRKEKKSKIKFDIFETKQGITKISTLRFSEISKSFSNFLHLRFSLEGKISVVETRLFNNTKS